MPRPRKLKIIHSAPIPNERALFKPAGLAMEGLPTNALTIVEFEAIRLIDAEDKSQNEAAALMRISQPTISRILNAARKKVADALVHGKAIKIEGGDFKFAEPGETALEATATAASNRA
ncbi:MAG: DUF134 domain-containing protein [Candidatus Lokiarchaeota archaeon]|nr:DUF134 domain-containing protein [Candidatus Lokiarchaeota archaeon]